MVILVTLPDLPHHARHVLAELLRRVEARRGVQLRVEWSADDRAPHVAWDRPRRGEPGEILALVAEDVDRALRVSQWISDGH